LTSLVTAQPQALFKSVGGAFLPTGLTRGPWRSDAQHGGPPAALLAHVSSRHVGDDEFTAQIEVELLRPVPLERLTVSVDDERLSRRVHRVRAELCHGDVLVARSTALVISRAQLGEPDWVPTESVPPQPADGLLGDPQFGTGGLRFHRDGVEHRLIEGDFAEPGPAFDWIRLRAPLIEGLEPSGLERALAAADFGSGVSAVYGPVSGTALINANLAVSLARDPHGEWISVDATTFVGEQGTGLCVSRLGDQSGRFGVATQTLLGYVAPDK